MTRMGRIIYGIPEEETEEEISSSSNHKDDNNYEDYGQKSEVDPSEMFPPLAKAENPDLSRTPITIKNMRDQGIRAQGVISSTAAGRFGERRRKALPRPTHVDKTKKLGDKSNPYYCEDDGCRQNHPTEKCLEADQWRGCGMQGHL